MLLRKWIDSFQEIHVYYLIYVLKSSASPMRKKMPFRTVIIWYNYGSACNRKFYTKSTITGLNGNIKPETFQKLILHL